LVEESEACDEAIPAPPAPLVEDDAHVGAALPMPLGGADAGDHALPMPLEGTARGDLDPALSLDGGMEVHEDSARKQRVRKKRAVDSAFKARRSSRLAAQENPLFVSMTNKAKALKEARFDLSGGSLRLRSAAEAAGLTSTAVPGPIPVPQLKALAAACGIDPDAVEDVPVVPALSP
jgi:hypothetical protein